MTILVDADGVLENLTQELPKLLNEKYGTDVKFEEIREWGFVNSFPTLSGEQIFSAELEETLYDRIRPIEGAAYYLKKIMDEGDTVYVVTNTPFEAISFKMKKVMERYFPFLSREQFIFTSRKQMIRGDLLIDDGVHNLLGGDYRKILFDAPANRAFDAEANGMIRVTSWKEVYEVVTKMRSAKIEKAMRANRL